eukprot:GDKJ01019236.1.p1 GENE.GDKJ01019236.1~~GDKJ01019236.1.p1  ORF type:complete len:156 (+),score=7.27 GDKJ01019236.1:42-509(+)
MPIPAFTLLNHDLVKAGVKANKGKLTGSSWMKYVSRLYKGLTPTELAKLRKRATTELKVADRPRKDVLPLKVQNYALAMKLPLEKVRTMYPGIAPNQPVATRLRIVARRLKIAVPKKQVVNSRYRDAIQKSRKMVAANKKALETLKNKDAKKAAK